MENTTLSPEIDQFSPEIVPKNSNIVTGDGCVRCCEQSRIGFELAVYEVIRQVIQSYEDLNDETQNRPLLDFRTGGIGLFTTQVPKGGFQSLSEFEKSYAVRHIPKTNPTAKPIPGVAITVLAVPVTAAIDNYIRGREAVATIGALTLVQTALEEISNLRKKTARKVGPCEECCRKRLLSQSNPRKVLTEKDRKRIRS